VIEIIQVFRKQQRPAEAQALVLVSEVAAHRRTTQPFSIGFSWNLWQSRAHRIFKPKRQAYDIKWPLSDFIINSSQVFTHHPKQQQLRPSHEQNQPHQRDPSLWHISAEDLAQDSPEHDQKAHTGRKKPTQEATRAA